MLAVGRKTQSRSQSSISHANAGDAGQFDSSSSSSRKTRGLCRLSFYESPPSADVDIETFETYGIARLQGKETKICVSSSFVSSFPQACLTGLIPREQKFDRIGLPK